MPSNSLMSIKHVPQFPRCQLSNGTSHVLLAPVSAELQATLEMVFTGEFLQTLKTDISTPSHSLMPIRHVPESPRCQLSNGTFHILLAPVSAELQATLEMVFTGKFLLTLKTDISTSSHSLAPIRHVPESPRCQLSNATSHALLASVPVELQAAMEMFFTNISTLSHSLTPIRYVLESPRCQLSNGASHILLVSCSAELPAAM
ncbi:hypothetical protein L873DRAFT_1856717 [Choiromyces venosus 120613-1]|uniref:Uncharacterized protein n=1 Tax=Choiromyces venosus 120613-1 TaxID=1336337 RepID=A0A3N4KD10_9PEZI|nr:hypothetical protein L873DRAFT_1856717 [Choiromyces venosus 120613-1]